MQLELTESASSQPAWYQRGRSDPWQNASAPLLSLTARPVKQNSKGKWVMGQLRWDTFRHSYYGYQLDEFSSEQIRWMRTFAAVYAAEDNTQVTSAHLPLERFDSPLLWQLLDQASDIGVALLAAKSGDAVVVHEPVSISLDLRAHGGGLRLAPHIGIDGGSSADPAALGVIGRPGHGLFWWDAATGPGTSSAARGLHLAPAKSPVPDAVRPLIRHRTELLVPAAARDSFLADIFPQLARAAGVICSDASVKLPRILPPELVLTAAHAPGELQLHWHWEYRSAGTVTRQPLPDAGTGYRDSAFEAQLLAQVAGTLTLFPVAWQEQFPDHASGRPGQHGTRAAQAHRRRPVHHRGTPRTRTA